MLISILHPSRSRIEKSKETTAKWLQNAGVDVELIVSVDSDDPQLDEYVYFYQTQAIINNNRSAVDAINHAAHVSKGDILIVVSDDTDCPRNWGGKILEATRNRKDWILKVNDGIQRWIITMPVMDRTYYSRFGYIYHPSFVHMFVDTWITHQADVLKKVIVRDDLIFKHKHYTVTKEKKDSTTLKADSTWEQGKQTYLRLVKENFLHLPDYGISHLGLSHIRWLQKNGL